MPINVRAPIPLHQNHVGSREASEFQGFAGNHGRLFEALAFY